MTRPKRKTDQEMHDELKAIYAEQDGAMPDLTQLERGGHSRLTRFLTRAILVLVVISAAAWGGFFVWNRGWFRDAELLKTSIEGPREARAGEEVRYTIRYENAGRVPVAALEMKLHLPLNFRLLSASPAPTEDAMWTLGSLTPSSDGAITLTGVFRSEVPSSETIQAFFTYRPANFSSDFQDIQAVTVAVDDSAVDIAVTGPEKALSGDEVTYAVNTQNSGPTAVERVRITAALPADFALVSAEPPPTSPDAAQWTIERLAPGQLMAITLTGRYTSSASGEQTLTARAGFLDEGGIVLAQAAGEAKTDVLGGSASFHLVVNGSTADQAVDLGQALRVSIDYANNSNETIEGLAFALSLEPAGGKALPVDWTAVELDGAVRTGNTITWGSAAVPAFARFTPNASGVIDLSIPMLAAIPPASADRFTMKLTASLAKVGSIVSPRSIETSPIAIALNSDLTASAEARYFTEDGEPLGTGPLPPEAGQTTSYRIVWKLANTLHALTSVTMTANLPPDAAWTERGLADIGTIRFDPVTRLVTWTISRLPTEVAAAQASFDVAITPDENDVGAFFKLTNATAVEAVDAATGDRLSRALDILTTELPADPGAAGKGVVVE